MHIQEGTNTTLTTCTKMTEEVDRRHGVNGNSSAKSSDDAPVHNTAVSATGGRLKFFKGQLNPLCIFLKTAVNFLVVVSNKTKFFL